MGNARGKLKGARAKGKRYERAFNKVVKIWGEGKGEIYIGAWIHFVDANGRGYAQPDQFLVLEDKIILFETKLTETDTAKEQTMELYVPLLERIFARPVVACEVFRNFRGPTATVKGLDELLGKSGGFWKFNWIEGEKL